MIGIEEIRLEDPAILMLGSHLGILQSILDYDFLIGRAKPSLVGIIASGRKQERFFWGEEEITLQVFDSVSELNDHARDRITMVISVQSSRRVLSTTMEALGVLPNLKLINIFAEQTPERHTIELIRLCRDRSIALIGPSSVGMLVPGYLKLGAIGGTRHEQISASGVLTAGHTAVISTSGGMVNELMNAVAMSRQGVSFAIALGGDMHPGLTAVEAFMLAQADSQTEHILYFGELGGTDEYEIAELIKSKAVTKDVTVYIAGTVADLFESPPQFGHAKAMARNRDESARSKREVLAASGAYVCDSFADIGGRLQEDLNSRTEGVGLAIGARRKGLISSHLSGVRGGDVFLLGRELLETTQSQELSSLVLSMILGEQVRSQKAIEFTDCVLRMLVDHGPQVSGAVNTIISARAGKDLVSSLASGLLTIGPRFGGAINDAAGYWLAAGAADKTGQIFVESFRKKGGIIPGIGHKKYRLDMPDPRVAALAEFTGNKNGDTFYEFARSVERVTTAKKGNLILNIDGAIAALMLDILQSELDMTNDQLRELVDIEFFNALFVLSRSIGFTAHYLDQRRHDEGLLRLPDDDIRYFA